jgi:hypothetical protein
MGESSKKYMRQIKNKKRKKKTRKCIYTDEAKRFLQEIILIRKSNKTKKNKIK